MRTLIHRTGNTNAALQEMAAYLNACLEEAPEDATGIAHALGDIARAKGMTQVARHAG